MISPHKGGTRNPGHKN